MTSQDKINSILKNSNLTQDLITPWERAFVFLKPKDLSLLVDIIVQATPKEIKEFSENLKDKIIALKKIIVKPG